MNRCLFALLACLLNIAAWCSSAAAANPERSLADIEGAIGRGLSWIEEHPASPQDGGLGDIIDEAVGFAVLQRLHRKSAEKAHFRQALHNRLAMLEALPEFEEAIHWPYNPLFDQYHLVLSVHLMRAAGKPSAFEEEIVGQAQRALGASPEAFPTLRITVAALLCHLGKSPAIALDALLQESLIERIAQGNPPKLLTPSPSEQAHQLSVLEFYAVVHEVVALTDFGRLPPSPWLAARREALSRPMSEAVSWASTVGDVDLVAELVLTAHFLREPLDGTLRKALDGLVSTQLPDGSWGDSATTRQNKRRHAVLTSVAALRAYANTLTEESLPAQPLAATPR